MSNLVFPSLAGVQLDINRPDEYSTNVLTASSGQEFRALFYSRPRARVRLTFEFLRSDTTNLEWQTLKGFYQRHMGRFDSFLFTDPNDSVITVAAKFGLGNATTTAFQLQKTFVADASLSSPVKFWPAIGDGFEPITELNGAPLIYVAGVLKTVGADYSIASGVVTFTSPPAAAASLTWTGAYYKRMRFDTDMMATERLVVDIWRAPTVGLVQVFG